MATLADFTFEGSTLGATLTPANSPFTSFVQPGWTYVNSPLLPSGGGTRAARSSATTGTASSAAGFPVTSTSTIYLRWYDYVEVFPTANTALVQLAFGGTARAELQLGPLGQFRMRNSAFSTIATSPNGSAPVDGWYRAEWWFDNVALKQQLRIYNGANLHTETPTWDSGAITIPASGVVTSVNLGAIANTAVMTTVWDNIKADDTTWVGSAVFVPVDPPPVAVAGADIAVDPNVADTFDLVGDASTGTITSYAWDDMTSGSAVAVTGTGLTRTITIPKNTTDTTRTYRLTVTGSGGSTTDTVTVNVLKYRHWRMVGTTLTPRRRQPITVDTIPPTVPGTPVATAGVGSVTVTTSGSTDAFGVAAYEWSQAGAVVGTTTGTTLTQNGLPASPVSYRVRARDAAGNWSAQSAVSNTVTPMVASAVRTMYGACPNGGTSAAAVVTKFGVGASVRLFYGDFTGTAAVRPSTVSILHASWKPPLATTISDADIIAACANLHDGDIVEVWHESDVKFRNGSGDLATMLAMKNQFYAKVVPLRTSGQIPNVLVANTWSGWSVDSTSPVNPSNLHCNADILGIDMDGIPANDNFYPFVTRQMGTKFVNAYNAGGYTGWTVPEFTMAAVPSDPNHTARTTWWQGQMDGISAGIPSASIPPAMAVMWFDTGGPLNPYEINGLTLPAEIAAWTARVASNT